MRVCHGLTQMEFVNLLPSWQSTVMKRILLSLSTIVFMLTACGEKDAICSCIEASDKMNKFSGEVLQGNKSEVDQKEWEQLKADKEKKCKDFKNMAGPEMLERKQSCE